MTKRARFQPKVFLLHGPGMILREAAGWRTLNGLAVQFGTKCYWWEIRG